MSNRQKRGSAGAQSAASLPKDELSKRDGRAETEQGQLPFDFSPQQLQVEHRRLESFTGPIPPPDVLAGYDAVVPGLADRIASMAESEQRHRHGVVQNAMDANAASDCRGQWMALTVAIAGLAVALLLGIYAAPYAGVILGALNLAAIVGLFLKREHGEADNEH